MDLIGYFRELAVGEKDGDSEILLERRFKIANCDRKFPRPPPLTSLRFYRMPRSDGREHSEWPSGRGDE